MPLNRDIEEVGRRLGGRLTTGKIRYTVGDAGPLTFTARSGAPLQHTAAGCADTGRGVTLPLHAGRPF